MPPPTHPTDRRTSAAGASRAIAHRRNRATATHSAFVGRQADRERQATGGLPAAGRPDPSFFRPTGRQSSRSASEAKKRRGRRRRRRRRCRCNSLIGSHRTSNSGEGGLLVRRVCLVGSVGRSVGSTSEAQTELNQRAWLVGCWLRSNSPIELQRRSRSSDLLQSNSKEEGGGGEEEEEGGAGEQQRRQHQRRDRRQTPTGRPRTAARRPSSWSSAPPRRRELCFCAFELCAD